MLSWTLFCRRPDRTEIHAAGKEILTDLQQEEADAHTHCSSAKRSRMNGFIFENHVWISQYAIAISLPVMLGGVLIQTSDGRFRAALVALVAYLAIVTLGMSDDIKNLSLIGVAHALIAFAIAGFAVRHLKVRSSCLIFAPCFFIGMVVLFNLANEGMGLELMGRWNDST